jgi:hypothetical protein
MKINQNTDFIVNFVAAPTVSAFVFSVLTPEFIDVGMFPFFVVWALLGLVYAGIKKNF